MSERPTISIFYGNEIADIFYCRNVGLSSLLIEAFNLYERYKDCRSFQNLRHRLALDYPNQVDYDNEEKEKEIMRFILECSEFPLLIDIKQHCIYCARYPKPMEKLLQYPDSRSMMSTLTRKQQYEFKTDYLYEFMLHSVFWMDMLDVEEILDLSHDAKGFYEYYW